MLYLWNFEHESVKAQMAEEAFQVGYSEILHARVRLQFSQGKLRNEQGKNENARPAPPSMFYSNLELFFRMRRQLSIIN